MVPGHLAAFLTFRLCGKRFSPRCPGFAQKDASGLGALLVLGTRLVATFHPGYPTPSTRPDRLCFRRVRHRRIVSGRGLGSGAETVSAACPRAGRSRPLDIVAAHIGGGEPEPLKHDFAVFWSRRISGGHRLIYRFETDLVQVIQCRFHY